MLESRSKNEWDSAFLTAKQRAQGYPDIISYIQQFYDLPEKYAGYTLCQIEGNLRHLGRGASWKLQEQILRLLDRQDTLAWKKSRKQLDYQFEICKGDSEFPTCHIHDDKLAREKLTQWSYNELWLKSYKFAQSMEVVRNNDDGSTLVKKYGTKWDSSETITILLSARCSCSTRIAHMHQCGHEYAVDKMFRIDKYDLRWLNQKSYDALISSENNRCNLTPLTHPKTNSYK